MSYNGHKNYETWIISMYIDGNYTGEFTCRKYESMAKDAVELSQELEETLDDVAYSFASNLASNVEDEIYVEDMLSESIVGDLLKAALSEVDWIEIAKGMLTTASESMV